MRIPRALGTIGVAASLLATGCERQTVAPPPRVPVRLTSGNPGAGFYPLGQALSRAYEGVLPGFELLHSESPGAVRNVQALQRGEADIGFAFADVAYMAYTGRLPEAPGRFDRLRGMAVLQLTPLHLVVRAGSQIRNVSDLRGHRVAFGPAGSGTGLTSSIVVRAFGLQPDDLAVERLPFGEAGRRLAAGTLDAAFFDVNYPAESVAVATRSGARLLPIDGPALSRLRDEYPFLRLTFIPGRTYPDHVARTPTLGIDSVLVCRADLDEAVVYQLTKALFDILPSISAERASVRDMNIDQAPATSIPLHRGAARYYRERELTR